MKKIGFVDFTGTDIGSGLAIAFLHLWSINVPMASFLISTIVPTFLDLLGYRKGRHNDNARIGRTKANSFNELMFLDDMRCTKQSLRLRLTQKVFDRMNNAIVPHPPFSRFDNALVSQNPLYPSGFHCSHYPHCSLLLYQPTPFALIFHFLPIIPASLI